MTARPATDRQYSYLVSLLRERDAAVTGVTDPDALVAHLRVNGASTSDLSALIDQVKALPTLSTTNPAAAPVKVNNYGGKCRDCGEYVVPGTGRIERKANGRGWDTIHLVGACTVEAPVTLNDGDLYVNDDGIVRRVYTTQNGRLAVKRLRLHEAGVNDDGTPSYHGSLRYEEGGLRSLRDDIAAGTAHAMTQAEAAAFGEQYSVCSNCGLSINDDRSLAAGYGPDCAANHGWFYPTYEEAARILGRPVVKPSGVIVTPDVANVTTA